MKPFNLALSWGLFFLSFTALFYLVDELLYESWLLEVFGERNENTEQLDRTMAYSLVVLAFAHAANIGLILSALNFFKKKPQAFTKTFITSSRAIAAWLLCFVPYMLFFVMSIVLLDTVWRREYIINKYKFLDSSTWDEI